MHHALIPAVRKADRVVSVGMREPGIHAGALLAPLAHIQPHSWTKGRGREVRRRRRAAVSTGRCLLPGTGLRVPLGKCAVAECMQLPVV